MDPERVGYFDNIGYSDLSDFFYIWLRRCLRTAIPDLFGTMLVPKARELVASTEKHGNATAAKNHFMEGLGTAFTLLANRIDDRFPMTIYYAFKQAEGGTEAGSGQSAGRASTGWETLLHAVLSAGLSITGTWPIHTEQRSRLRALGSNALASSIVLVCRPRSEVRSITRADFRRDLRNNLPAALRVMKYGNIAPVDLAQACIGPGMAIFSRYKAVLEADGNPMTVRTALELINQALDEYLTEQEGEFDSDTRFALTWFEERQFDSGPFGQAETLAKARNVSVEGVEKAGILEAAAGKVRLLKRPELPDDWSPATDTRATVWEAAQHLIKCLDSIGEQGAADLLAHLGPLSEPARDLAYRLYQICERKGWAEEARAYNGLVIAWPELEKLAESARRSNPVQQDLL